MEDVMNLQEEINKVAYELFVKSGCIKGRDMDNWLEAERIVMEKYNLQKPAESALTVEITESAETFVPEQKKVKNPRAKGTLKKAVPKKSARRTTPKKKAE